MKKFIISNIFIIVFFILFSFVTLGYAFYNQLLSLNGNISIKEAGIIEITEARILKDECSNLTSYSNPNYERMHIDFTIKTRSNNFSATYLVTITNNSNRDYTYTGFPVNAKIEGNENVPVINSTVTNVLNNEIIHAGEIIKSKESITVKIRLDFSLERNTSNITVVINGDVSSSEDNSGLIKASISPQTGNLKNEALASFDLSIINTFKYRRVINLASSNENIMIVDDSGNPLNTIAINANSSGNYKIYMKVKEGSVFLTDTTVTNLILSSNGIVDIDTGEIVLDVDKDILATDNKKVEISNVSISISNVNPVEGEAVVNFTRADTGGSSVTNYGIILINNDTKEEVLYETNNAITSYTIKSLEPGNYSVKVYGVDEALNSGANDCSRATTEKGYCTSSDVTNLKWRFNVTTALNDLSFEGDSSALIYSSYSCVLSVSNWWGGYALPESIKITMDNVELVPVTDYTYDASTGNILIKKVTGDINIEASGRQSICLIEGTNIRLANGQYKKIEDIGYDDLLVVYDHDNGGITYEYPIFIEKENVTRSYQKTYFSDGSFLETYGPHSVFSMDLMDYVDVSNEQLFHKGSLVAKVDNNGKVYSVKVLKIVKKNQEKKYYHVFSTRYHNIIANDFITTDGTGYSDFLYSFNKDLTWGDDRNDYLKTNDLFDYSFLAPYFPQYLFIGFRMEEAKNVYNKGLLDINYYASLLSSDNTKETIKDLNGNNMWMVTTSDDRVNCFNKSQFLLKENSLYVLKKPKKVKNFKGWLNTGDNKIYQVNDVIKVKHGIHLIALYKEST